MQDEFELKLSLRPRDLPRLRDLLKTKGPASSRARTQDLVSVYFDTPDRRLRGQSLALRVRKVGRRFMQNVEVPGPRIGSACLRDRWQGPVPTEDPFIQAIDNEDFRRAITAVGPSRLAPVFRTAIRRTIHGLSLPGRGKASAHIDIGEIVAAGGSEPVCELKLGFKEPLPLFELALELQSALPLRLSTMSRARRGYLLVSGEPPDWSKRTPPDLTGEINVDEAMARIFQSCLDRLQYNEACTLESENPEGIHQMRVAMRRWRSALRMFRPFLPPEDFDWVTGEVKWLTGQLAAARDWDVFADEIVEPVALRMSAMKAFDAFRARLRAVRDDSRRAARRAIESGRYGKFLLSSGKWLAKRAWRNQPVNEVSACLFNPIADFSDRVLGKHHRKVCKQGRRFEGMTAAERHRLRINVKRLRYAIDFFGSLYPAKGKERFSSRLEGLQNDLGYANDFTVATDLVERIGSSCGGQEARLCRQAGSVVIGWHAHAMARADGVLADDVEGFIRCKPFWPAGQRRT